MPVSTVFANLLNLLPRSARQGVHHMPITLNIPHIIVTREEVCKAIQKQKNHKAPGCCGIRSEIFKCREAMIDYLTVLFNSIITSNEAPEEWNISKICPILKSGKPETCLKSFRPVSLLCTARKILSTVLLNRWNFYFKDLNHAQTGGRPNHNTTEQVFALKLLCERARDKNRFKIHAATTPCTLR
eukprot:Platyproteum_vivax@DN7576_c2_g3_i1.p1